MTATAIATELQNIALSELTRNTKNPRRPVTKKSVEDLAASIKELGVLEPLVVVVNPAGGYTLVAGERRFVAAGIAKLDTVPCLVRDLDDTTIAKVLMVENLIRSGLSHAEQANGIQELLDLGEDFDAIAATLTQPVEELRTIHRAGRMNKRASEAVHNGMIPLEYTDALYDLEPYKAEHKKVLDAIEDGKNIDFEIKQAFGRIRYADNVTFAMAWADKHGAALLDSEPGWGTTKTVLTNETEEELIEHATAGCHGVYVARHGEHEIIHYCLTPKNHKSVKPQADLTPEEIAVKEEERRQRRLVIGNNKVWEDANEARTAWLETLYTRTTAPKNALPSVVALVFHLGTIEHTWGVDGAKLAAMGAPAATQALLVKAVATYERGLKKTVWRDQGAVFARHLRALQAWGYTLTAPEALFVSAEAAGDDTRAVDYAPTED